MTLHDIRTKIQLHIGHEQALVVQNFQTLHKVVCLAFGAEEKEKPPEPKTKEELKRSFMNVFGSK